MTQDTFHPIGDLANMIVNKVRSHEMDDSMGYTDELLNAAKRGVAEYLRSTRGAHYLGSKAEIDSEVNDVFYIRGKSQRGERLTFKIVIVEL